ncbi:LysE/ArgO family amino acid transporter [Ramlibacter tataouinensis]|uniref:Candidate lysine efflux permease n=1 Tax=Ramlibacter tataouinensis (strain ATCC BAA-407 / DSM 14655 / LMG 21543 / TTB310) TaxID=365046 RepID=F5Y4M1_RAMTT|nr:LysE family transporter [Ramlibacter tataouinensis]AEG91339.1 Candidate lysine efflux permease [Ramlibacter tataouinensis TTB310]
MTASAPAFTAGMVMSLSLIVALGPQNAHILRMGLRRQHLWLTVAVCALADVALIGLGVLGLAQLGGLSDKLQGALVGAGALFLAVYGWHALRRALHPPGALAAAAASGDAAAQQPPVRGLRSAVLDALAFSWLNPHAWLDTAVLIGSASLAYGQAGRAFGLGAAAGSVVWFLTLGAAAFWLGRRLTSLHVWRVLDALVALMMWGSAVWLVAGLA